MLYDSACAYFGPLLLCDLSCEGGSFARSQYPTGVYITCFRNDEIQTFFPGFNDTLSNKKCLYNTTNLD